MYSAVFDLNVSESASQIYWALKITAKDIVVDNNGTEFYVDFTPSYAWISLGKFNSAGKIHSPFMCENGGFCGAGRENFLEAVEGLMSGTIRIGIQRWRGGTDTVSPVSLRVCLRSSLWIA
jgi:hypothetical protein